ncbi:hypothetical protein F4801DRAFT_583497 [Xylaria longipes]|nr:hypothetical protein F4801DRAFT_583497 [Xylaria longipes]RYC65691.1 hypothetical protein CHU98_g496 [Xylaria longipes]
MFFTNFNEPTFALAAHFPELNPVALLQLVEAPVVRLAFYEFRSRFWDACRKNGQAKTQIQFVEKALNDFSNMPAGYGRINDIGGGECSSPDDYEIRDSFYAFMSRVYAWATQDYLDLPIRRHLEDTSISASILWGILGICISVHEAGKFPEPLFPIPTEGFEHVDGELDLKDVVDWRFATRAATHTPKSFPLWQEWRVRHEALVNPKNCERFIRFWAAKVADDYSSGLENAAEEAQDWLKILKIARLYKDVQGTRVQTKHCIFEIRVISRANVMI